MKPFARNFAIVVGAWTLLSLLLATQIYFYDMEMGRTVAFRPVWVGILLDYWLWALLTPLVFWMAKRVPFSKQRLLRTIVIQCSFFVFVYALHVALSHLLRLPLPMRNFHGPTIQLRFLNAFYEDLWMYWPLVGLWNLIDYQKRYREQEVKGARLESQLAKAQLEALKAQIQPHFLFNTLNSVSALMQNDVEGAEDMLADLSSMLRTSLHSSATQEISLDRELELLEAYLRIQKRRFDERLQISIDADLETLPARVPTLILQPIVENAIRHGIAPLARPGHIRISSEKAGDRLLVRVSDDGPGLPADHREGIGLSNTRQRLEQLYGTDSLELESISGKGVTVSLSLPFRLAEIETDESDHEDSNRHRGRRSPRTAPDSVAAADSAGD